MMSGFHRPPTPAEKGLRGLNGGWTMGDGPIGDRPSLNTKSRVQNMASPTHKKSEVESSTVETSGVPD